MHAAARSVVLTRISLDQLDPLQDVDIRQPSVHRQDFTWVTDYLIGCHTTVNPLQEGDNDLCLFTGSNEYVMSSQFTFPRRADFIMIGEMLR